MTDSQVLRIARAHVEHFRDETRLMANHFEAIECLECEVVMQVAIEAFHWIVRADETIRKAVYLGLAEYDANTDEAIEKLLRGWLNLCEAVEPWIDVQLHRGFEIESLQEFRSCQEQTRSIVHAFDETVPRLMNDADRQLRDEALAEHRFTGAG